MKILLVPKDGMILNLAEHSTMTTVSKVGEISGLMYENPAQGMITENIPEANTNVAVRNLILNPERAKVVKNHLGLVKGTPVSSLYSIFNGSRFADWIEVSYSTRFMSGDIGPVTGFTIGAGTRVTDDPLLAFPQLKVLIDFFKEINYRGEVCINFTEKFLITNIIFGHSPGHFGLFAELSKSGVDNILEFIFNTKSSCQLYSSLAGALLVSKVPYPYAGTNMQKITAPSSAEKHLWRFNTNSVSTILITISGNSVREVRRRMKRTTDNLVSNDTSLQFRSDWGFCHKFYLCQNEWEKFKNMEVNFSKSSPTGSIQSPLVQSTEQKVPEEIETSGRKISLG